MRHAFPRVWQKSRKMRQRITGDTTRAKPTRWINVDPGIQTSGKSWERNERASAETHDAQDKRKRRCVLALHGRVCVCVCVCKGVCGGSEVVIDENNDRLAGTGQSETGAIITLWTSRGAFKLLFEKHLERDDSAVCISACTVCEGVCWRGANALCVCVCVCVCVYVCVCALIRVIKLASVNRLMLSCQQRA